MNKEEVKKLAVLSRIDIEDTEAEKLSSEFEAILSYVREVKAVAGPGSLQAQLKKSDYIVKNVMREDNKPHEGGIYTEKLLAEAPDREGNFVKVKNIL